MRGGTRSCTLSPHAVQYKNICSVNAKLRLVESWDKGLHRILYAALLCLLDFSLSIINEVAFLCSNILVALLKYLREYCRCCHHIPGGDTIIFLVMIPSYF